MQLSISFGVWILVSYLVFARDPSAGTFESALKGLFP
jgi:hypothetical protein